jgi:hypothetical protein
MNDALLQYLPADGPHPDLGTNAELYGQFVGSWDLDNNQYDDSSGQWHRRQGECHFRWILQGRAIQDLWGSPDRGFGTTIRAYDSSMAAWRIHWFAPGGGSFCTLIGNADGDRIMQEGSREDGRPIRWSFCDITPDSFTWRGEISDDDGKTWRLAQEMQARRRA